MSVLLVDFNAHMGNNRETWLDVIGRNRLADVNPIGVLLLDFCTKQSLPMMNTMLELKDALGGRASGVDKICNGFLKALDVVRHLEVM